MTINELHIAFKIAMDKNAAGVAFGGCPAFLPAEIDLFLNQAYIEVINNKFTGTNTLKTPFEGSVKRIADLEKLIATDSAVAITLDNGTNVLRVSDFFNSAGAKHRMFFVQAVLNFNTNKSTVDLVDHETAKRFLQTYNNDPWINTPVATLENNNLLVFIDTHKMLTPYTIDITYVKYPVEIINTNGSTEITEVPEYVLYEVVNRAAAIALENIESQRTNTKVQLNNIQE